MLEISWKQFILPFSQQAYSISKLKQDKVYNEPQDILFNENWVTKDYNKKQLN